MRRAIPSSGSSGVERFKTATPHLSCSQTVSQPPRPYSDCVWTCKTGKAGFAKLSFGYGLHRTIRQPEQRLLETAMPKRAKAQPPLTEPGR